MVKISAAAVVFRKKSVGSSHNKLPDPDFGEKMSIFSYTGCHHIIGKAILNI